MSGKYNVHWCSDTIARQQFENRIIEANEYLTPVILHKMSLVEVAQEAYSNLIMVDSIIHSHGTQKPSLSLVKLSMEAHSTVELVNSLIDTSGEYVFVY